MADLTSIDRLKFEKLFGMSSGYVLNFSNSSFKEFINEITGIDIEDPKYDYASCSKANRLRAFWRIETNEKVGLLLDRMLQYWNTIKEINGDLITQSEWGLYNECKLVARALNSNDGNIHDNSRHEQHSITTTLRELLINFDDQALSSDHQKRGYVLESLLNQLFTLEKFEVKQSFRRNDGGEQIDGAFIYNNWFYLVECKWKNSLSDIRELDSLLGKVNRSGKQTMGVFISINGWSSNVINLLKQNQNKSIFLVDGYDLRCVLDGNLLLRNLLSEKIAKLNFESEPFYSAKWVI